MFSCYGVTILGLIITQMTKSSKVIKPPKAVKTGKAAIPTIEEQQHLFDVIEQHRYPEKNSAIMQVSFKLGLRVQEIALLQLKDVCELSKPKSNLIQNFKIHKIMNLPAAYTKGSDAMNRSKSKYERRTVRFKCEEFDQILATVAKMTKGGIEINPSDFYPVVEARKGKSRKLPLAHEDLRAALDRYLLVRLDKDKSARPTDPLFINQKGGPYSPNTLQGHMALMLKKWAGIEKASSHSGRRAVIDHIIHTQGKSVRIAQSIAGHKDASTTIIYTDANEIQKEEVLLDIDKTEDALKGKAKYALTSLF